MITILNMTTITTTISAFARQLIFMWVESVSWFLSAFPCMVICRQTCSTKQSVLIPCHRKMSCNNCPWALCLDHLIETHSTTLHFSWVIPSVFSSKTTESTLHMTKTICFREICLFPCMIPKFNPLRSSSNCFRNRRVFSKREGKCCPFPCTSYRFWDKHFWCKNGWITNTFLRSNDQKCNFFVKYVSFLGWSPNFFKFSWLYCIYTKNLMGLNNVVLTTTLQWPCNISRYGFHCVDQIPRYVSFMVNST